MASVQRWLDAYVAAWRSYDPEEIRQLFTEDAVYRPLPYDEPLRGGEAITKAWIADPDPPGSWTADYQAVAATGEVGVGRGAPGTGQWEEDRSGSTPTCSSCGSTSRDGAATTWNGG